jgi:hypothetical protein
MVVLSVACGMAWLVSPLYDLTLQGILSNDSLGIALVMYVVSLGLMAFRVRHHQLLKFQFRVRTLLTITGLVAILLAMGPFGYVALAAISIGLFFVLSWTSANFTDV